ncbi:MAG: hypothetical protein ACOCP8_08420 [archaeon]
MEVINKPFEKDLEDELIIKLGLAEMDILARALKEYQENMEKRIDNSKKILEKEEGNNSVDKYNLKQDKPYLDILKNMIEDIDDLGSFG